MEHQNNPAAETAVKRRGDLQKCPVCGSPVDSEAYYCPTCHNYFCYHCRARLVESDSQLQCVDTNCEYYGKLVCSVCDSAVEKEEPPSVYAEPEDGYWPLLLLAAIIIGILIWWLGSFLVGLIVGIVLFAGGGHLLHRYVLNIFGRERTVTRSRVSSCNTCVRCQSLVKVVHDPTR